jgi:hypothetical protein
MKIKPFDLLLAIIGLIGLAIMGILAIWPEAAAAQTTQSETDDRHPLGTQPDIIPGTQIKWPPHDKACDRAFQGQEWDTSIDQCRKALDDYTQAISAIQSDSTIPTTTLNQIIYDKAYTHFELAYALSQTSNSSSAEMARLAYGEAHDTLDLYHLVCDPIRNAQFKNLTVPQLSIYKDFVELIEAVHKQFPSINLPDQESDT